MKTALVLEGGAMRGMYTAGVLDVLMEHDIKVDCVIGVSAGALFGINYISNQKGRALRYNKTYRCDKRYMGLYSLITTGNIMNKDFCFNELVYKLDKFDFEAFYNSKIKFYAVISNVETGEAEYIDINDLNSDMEYLRASGSMPLVSKIVTINNQKYLDGGIADSIPFKKAKELGYDKIIVVLTRQLGYQKKKSKLLPYKIMYRKYPNFVDKVSNRYLRYNNTLKEIAYEEQKKNIFVIRPSRNPNIKRLEKNLDKLQDVYDLGKLDANQRLEELIKYLDN